MKKRLFAKVFASVLAATLVVTNVSTTDAFAATKRSVTISTQNGLNRALAKEDVGQITIKTSVAKRLVIPEGDYTGKTLIINSPKLRLNNSGNFKTITVEDAKAVADNAEGNIIKLKDTNDLKFYATKKSKDTKVYVAAEGGNIDLVVNGQPEAIKLMTKTDVTISGSTEEKVPVTVTSKAKGADVTMQVPVTLTTPVKVNVTVEKGAEDSTIATSKENVTLFIENKSEEVITITDVAGNSVEVDTDSTATANASTGKVDAKPIVTPEVKPTEAPVVEPTKAPVAEPTAAPTVEPTATPTPEVKPTEAPVVEPTKAPVAEPTVAPTVEPTATPTPEVKPTEAPVVEPTKAPDPDEKPTDTPTPTPGEKPTDTPTPTPDEKPTDTPIPTPDEKPTDTPIPTPDEKPTDTPTPTPGDQEETTSEVMLIFDVTDSPVALKSTATGFVDNKYIAKPNSNNIFEDLPHYQYEWFEFDENYSLVGWRIEGEDKVLLDEKGWAIRKYWEQDVLTLVPYWIETSSESKLIFDVTDSPVKLKSTIAGFVDNKLTIRICKDNKFRYIPRSEWFEDNDAYDFWGWIIKGTDNEFLGGSDGLGWMYKYWEQDELTVIPLWSKKSGKVMAIFDITDSPVALKSTVTGFVDGKLTLNGDGGFIYNIPNYQCFEDDDTYVFCGWRVLGTDIVYHEIYSGWSAALPVKTYVPYCAKKTDPVDVHFFSHVGANIKEDVLGDDYAYFVECQRGKSIKLPDKSIFEDTDREFLGWTTDLEASFEWSSGYETKYEFYPADGDMIYTLPENHHNVTHSLYAVWGPEKAVEEHQHNWQAVSGSAAAATCTTSGKEADLKCTVCGADKIGITIDALGHDLKAVSGSAVAATCTKNGKEADKKCSRCDYTETGAIIPAGHKEAVSHEIPATCVTSGREYGTYCSVCKQIFTGMGTIPPTGQHDYDEDGKCKNCNATKPGESGLGEGALED